MLWYRACTIVTHHCPPLAGDVLSRLTSCDQPEVSSEGVTASVIEMTV